MSEKNNKPPGLSSVELLKLRPKLRQNPLGTFTELSRRFGHVFRFGGLWETFNLTHPDHVEHVLQNNARNYLRGRSYRRLKESVGNGLLISEGEYSRRQRRLMQPAFHRHRIAGFGQAMTDSTLEVLETWQPRADRGEPLELYTEMSGLTLRIVGKTLFNTNLHEHTEAFGRMMTIASEHAIKRMWQLIRLPAQIPTSANQRYRAAMRDGNKIIYDLINERRQDANHAADDLLSMLMSARDEETGRGMSDKQLRDEAFSIMVAGHETTALMLSWAWYLLSTHKEAEAKLEAELASVLNGRIPSVEDLPRLKYTAMVIQEAMRLYPAVYGLGRTAIAEDVIGGYHVPAKAEVVLFPYLTHRHPDFWNNPDRFEPERFTPERASARPRFAYFPFGGGPRQCIGNNYAMMEGQLILATVAQKFRLRLVPGHPVEPVISITLRPRYGIRMTLHRM